jgi:hypothetical protein
VRVCETKKLINITKISKTNKKSKINNLLERGTEADNVVVVLDWVLVKVR